MPPLVLAAARWIVANIRNQLLSRNVLLSYVIQSLQDCCNTYTFARAFCIYTNLGYGYLRLWDCKNVSYDRRNIYQTKSCFTEIYKQEYRLNKQTKCQGNALFSLKFRYGYSLKTQFFEHQLMDSTLCTRESSIVYMLSFFASYLYKTYKDI